MLRMVARRTSWGWVVCSRVLEVTRRGSHFGIWLGHCFGRCSRGERPRRFPLLCVSTRPPGSTDSPPRSLIVRTISSCLSKANRGSTADHLFHSYVLYLIVWTATLIRLFIHPRLSLTPFLTTPRCPRPDPTLFVSCYVIALCSLIPPSQVLF